MKVGVDDNEWREVDSVVQKGMLVGGTVGLSSALVANFLANKYFAYYRSLRTPLKTFFIVSGSVAAAIVHAEKQLVAFDKQRYSGDRLKALAEIDAARRSLSAVDRLRVMVTENQTKVLMGTVTAAVVGSVYHSYNNKHLTRVQKAVNARLLASFLGFVAVLGSVAIAMPAKENEKEKYEKDQWKAALQQIPTPTPNLLSENNEAVPPLKP